MDNEDRIVALLEQILAELKRANKEDRIEKAYRITDSPLPAPGGSDTGHPFGK